MRRSAAQFSWFAFACVSFSCLAACGEGVPSSAPSAPAFEVHTQVPIDAHTDGLDPADRWPSGSRVVRIDSSRPDAPPVVLSTGLDAAGGVWIDPTAEHVLFAGRTTPDEPYAVWRVDLDGQNRRRVVARKHDCGRAAELPDGRVVFAAALSGASGALGARSPWALFVAEADGSNAKQITFGAGLDLDPMLLRDGRVLYTAWLPGAPGRPAGGVLALLTVHTDGTGVQLFHGDQPTPRRKLLARYTPDGALVYLSGNAAASRWRIDVRAPLEPARDLGSVSAACPPGLRTTDVQPVHIRPVPQCHLSMVDPTGDSGRLLCIDARRGEGKGGRRIRIRALVDTSSSDALPRGRVLGETALAADGSFFIEVPADRPLALELLDRDGALLRRSVTPFWVRPNESRGCIGCHEPRDAAPPNVRPLAVGHRPVRAWGSPKASEPGS